MNRKTIAIIAELIPAVSAVVSLLAIVSENDSALLGQVNMAAMLLAFLGFVFFFIGRRLAGGDTAVKILGILDWLATIYVIVLYVLAIFSFGL